MPIAHRQSFAFRKTQSAVRALDNLFDRLFFRRALDRIGFARLPEKPQPGGYHQQREKNNSSHRYPGNKDSADATATRRRRIA